MTDTAASIPFPTADEPETRYTANSGGEVLLRYVEPDLFDVFLVEHPAYRGALRRTGRDFFDLASSSGGLSATNISEEDLIQLF